MRARGRVDIVGSGLVGALVAYELARKGFRVRVWEKGPTYPYPPRKPFEDLRDLDWRDPALEAAGDLSDLEQSGTYGRPLSRERPMRTGGAGTIWEAITLRMSPSQFRTRTEFGYGVDWPIGYDDLEPHYARAEELLAVAGTDDDNPWAPRRSRGYPMPPFLLGHDDLWLKEKLAAAGLALHTTPQARLRRPVAGRAACANIGSCVTCPIGARHDPNRHLQAAVATGRCELIPGASVRRVVLDPRGRARAIVVRREGSAEDREESVDVLVLAMGGLETPRLLLLSRDERHPDGIGNHAGWLGRSPVFHRIWLATLDLERDLWPARAGFWTGQSHQFLEPSRRGRRGGIKVELSTRASWEFAGGITAANGREALDRLAPRLKRRIVGFHAESLAAPENAVTLGARRDRHGDPVARVHVGDSDFDHATYLYARDLYDRYVAASGARRATMARENAWYSGGHHMSGMRMGGSAGEGVADPWGRVHGSTNLYLAGTGLFPGCSGPVNPTLTALALALRSVERIAAGG